MLAKGQQPGPTEPGQSRCRFSVFSHYHTRTILVVIALCHIVGSGATRQADRARPVAVAIRSDVPVECSIGRFIECSIKWLVNYSIGRSIECSLQGGSAARHCHRPYCRTCRRSTLRAPYRHALHACPSTRLQTCLHTSLHNTSTHVHTQATVLDPARAAWTKCEPRCAAAVRRGIAQHGCCFMSTRMYAHMSAHLSAHMSTGMSVHTGAASARCGGSSSRRRQPRSTGSTRSAGYV